VRSNGGCGLSKPKTLRYAAESRNPPTQKLFRSDTATENKKFTKSITLHTDNSLLIKNSLDTWQTRRNRRTNPRSKTTWRI